MNVGQPNRNGRRQAGVQMLPAFTLVELLVVIGIIALLISILLPALAKARQSAQRAVCGSRLHAIMLAANVFANEHKGYYPLIGYLNGTDGYFDPAGLADTYTNHYAYMNDGNGGNFLAPITFALGTEMGFTRNLGDITIQQQIVSDVDQIGVIRHFLCPSQCNDVGEIKTYSWLHAGVLPPGYLNGYGEQLSYVFNEAVLGFDDANYRLRGHVTSIRQAAKTVFAMDGLTGNPISRPTGGSPANFGPTVPKGPYGFLSIYNLVIPGPVTLADILTHRKVNNKAVAGDPQNFDQIRHQGKLNIAFCDGHVELRQIPAFTLPSPTAYQAVLTKDPNATEFQNIYLLAP